MTLKDISTNQSEEGVDSENPFLDIEVVEGTIKAKEKEQALFDSLGYFYNEYLIWGKQPEKDDKQLFELAKNVFKNTDDYGFNHEELFHEAMVLSKVTLREYLQLKTILDFVASDGQINKGVYQEVFGEDSDGLLAGGFGRKRLEDIINEIEVNVSAEDILDLLDKAKNISMMERWVINIKGSELFSELAEKQQQEIESAYDPLAKSLDAKLDSITDDFLDDKMGQVSDNLTAVKDSLPHESKFIVIIDPINKVLEKIGLKSSNDNGSSPLGMM